MVSLTFPLISLAHDWDAAKDLLDIRHLGRSVHGSWRRRFGFDLLPAFRTKAEYDCCKKNGEGRTSRSRYTEAEMIGVLKQLEAGRRADDVAGSRADGVVCIEHRYESRRTDEPLSTKAGGELAREKPRFRYRRLHVLLRRTGERVNHKRLHRIYREARLSIRRKKRKHCVREGRSAGGADFGDQG